MSGQIRRFSTSTAIVLVLAGPAYAADFGERFEGTKPAVSGFNGKLDLGYFHSDFTGLPGDVPGGYVIGSLSLPVGHSFGVQVDAGYMGLRPSAIPIDVGLGGVGIHSFWRNPDQGLIGIYGHYVAMDFDGLGTVDSWRYGVEGELYLDRVSIEAFAGGDSLSGAGVSETFFNGQIRAAYYITDNFRVHAGLVHQFDETMGQIGLEAMVPFGGNMASVYAGGNFGEDSTTVRAGLRFYFGESGKSLMARHREDDPASKLFDYFSLGGISNALGLVGGGGEEGGGGGEEGGGGGEEGGGYT